MIESTTIWVCVDCYLAHHGLLDESATPDREPLKLISDGDRLYSGIAFGEGSEQCEQITFTWSACEGCGSTLGGERYAMTLEWDN